MSTRPANPERSGLFLTLQSQCPIFTIMVNILAAIFTRLVNFASPLRSTAQTTQVWLDPHNAPRIAIVFHTMEGGPHRACPLVLA